MSSAETPVWVYIATIILGGGGAVSLLTWFYDKLAKKREETVDMAKFRMEGINKKYNDYMNLIQHSFALYHYLDNLNELSEYEKTSLFLKALLFLQTTDRIVKNGNFLLADQDAESVISDLVGFNWIQFRKIFPDFDYVKFRSLDSQKPFMEIKAAIDTTGDDYNTYYNQFFSWLTNPQNKTELHKIKMVSKCINELLNLEVNRVFELWYNRKFHVHDLLGDDTIQYLINEHNFSYSSRTLRLIEFYPRYYKKLF